MLNLTYKFAEEGYCRVYYNRKLPEYTGVLLYCFQDEGIGSNTDFKLYRCSLEGEPEYTIPIENIGIVDVPKGDSEIEQKLTRFLANYPYRKVVS
jgi:hypothetical protein